MSKVRPPEFRFGKINRDQIDSIEMTNLLTCSCDLIGGKPCSLLFKAGVGAYVGAYVRDRAYLELRPLGYLKIKGKCKRVSSPLKNKHVLERGEVPSAR
jgi:hypothetical protein